MRLGIIFFTIFISLSSYNLFLIRLAYADFRAINVVSNLDSLSIYKKYKCTNHALIIGIDEYKFHTDLNTAVNDARTIATILEEKYFFNKKNILLLLNK